MMIDTELLTVLAMARGLQHFSQGLDAGERSERMENTPPTLVHPVAPGRALVVASPRSPSAERPWGFTCPVDHARVG